MQDSPPQREMGALLCNGEALVPDFKHATSIRYNANGTSNQSLCTEKAAYAACKLPKMCSTIYRLRCDALSDKIFSLVIIPAARRCNRGPRIPNDQLGKHRAEIRAYVVPRAPQVPDIGWPCNGLGEMRLKREHDWDACAVEAVTHCTHFGV